MLTVLLSKCADFMWEGISLIGDGAGWWWRQEVSGFCAVLQKSLGLLHPPARKDGLTAIHSCLMDLKIKSGKAGHLIVFFLGVEASLSERIFRPQCPGHLVPLCRLRQRAGSVAPKTFSHSHRDQRGSVRQKTQSWSQPRLPPEQKWRPVPAPLCLPHLSLDTQ